MHALTFLFEENHLSDGHLPQVLLESGHDLGVSHLEGQGGLVQEGGLQHLPCFVLGLEETLTSIEYSTLISCPFLA